MRAKVSWFNNKKGYGFASTGDDLADIFIHYSAIQGEGFKTLNKGDEVELELFESPKGLQAKNVVKVA